MKIKWHRVLARITGGIAVIYFAIVGMIYLVKFLDKSPNSNPFILGLAVLAFIGTVMIIVAVGIFLIIKGAEE